MSCGLRLRPFFLAALRHCWTWGFETFVFSHLEATCGGHYDVLWLGSTNLLFGGARWMSLLDGSFLNFVLRTSSTNFWRWKLYKAETFRDSAGSRVALCGGLQPLHTCASRPYTLLHTCPSGEGRVALPWLIHALFCTSVVAWQWVILYYIHIYIYMYRCMYI